MEMVMYSKDQHGVTSPESDTSTNDEQEDEKNNKNCGMVSNSLLAILDDKNKSISMLKKQIDNQKLQLGFYLHKILSGPKIEALSETCTPNEVEENIHLNLAMSNFCKQMGVKSRIMQLHQRMATIEKRILSLVYQQEDMIKYIVDKVIDIKTEDSLNHFNENSYTLTKILDYTIKLRKDIDTFRTCCNRLIVIEDERNALVEQVYSMPISQRMSCGVLLASQYERMRLEKEVSEIKREQRVIEQRLSGPPLNVVKCSDVGAIAITENHEVNANLNVVQKLTQEANAIIKEARERCAKYEEEIKRLRESNASLIVQNETLQYRINEKSNADKRLHNLIEELRKVKEDNANSLKEITTRTKEIIQERDVYRTRLEQYKEIEQQVQCLRVQLSDMDVLRRQRDYFKSQVEDLQAIRAAYSQLVERCPPSTNQINNETQEQGDKVKEMEERVTNMATEIKQLNATVADKDTQIKHLLVIIERIGSYKETKHNGLPELLSYIDEVQPDSKTLKSISQNTSVTSMKSATTYAKEGDFENMFTNNNVFETNSDHSDNTVEDQFTQKHFISRASVQVQTLSSQGLKTSTVHEVICFNRTYKHDSVSVKPEKEFGVQCSLLHYTTNTTKALDEYELMKDASREITTITLPSMHRRFNNSIGTDVDDLKEVRNINIANKLMSITENLHDNILQPGKKTTLVKNVTRIYDEI